VADLTNMMSPLVYVAVRAVQPENTRHPAPVRAYEVRRRNAATHVSSAPVDRAALHRARGPRSRLLLSRWLHAASHTGAP
jgi:hypothetical protein